MNSSRFATVLLGLFVMVLAFAAGIWVSMQQSDRPDAAVVDGLLWPDPPAVPAFNLYDQHGQPFTQDHFAGRWSLVFFGFTHCPDVCPTSLEAMARAHAELQNDPAWADRGQVVFISVDPERDDAANLGQYVEYFSPDFIGVSGGIEELKALTRALGVLFVKVEQGDSYTMDHSAGVFFVSPDLHLVSVLTPPYQASGIAQRFRAISAFFGRES